MILFPDSRSAFNSFAMLIAVVGPANPVDEKSINTAGIASWSATALINLIRSLDWIWSDDESAARLERKSDPKTSWSTTVPCGSMKRTLPLGSLTSGPEEDSAPIIRAVKKIKNDFKLSSKVIFFPGWAEELFNDDEAGRSVIPLNNDFFNIVFTGNVGEAQDFSSLIKVAKKCKHIDSVKWHIVGDGRMKSWIENEILENSLENTIYTYGNFDISKMPAILESADALLIALKNNPIFEVTIPGKFQTYCTAGKPIISLAKGEVNKIVDDINAGVTGDSDNLDEFAKKIIDLSKMPIDKLKDMGKNASSFAKKEFNRDHLIDRFEDCLVHHEMEK